jgi:hypothetical protein
VNVEFLVFLAGVIDVFWDWGLESEIVRLWWMSLDMKSLKSFFSGLIIFFPGLMVFKMFRV